MSGLLFGEVWMLQLPSTQQAVLLALADHAHDDGSHCFPSIGYVAWKIGASRSTVQRTIRELRKARILVLVREGRRHRPNEYRINLAAGVRKAPYGGPDKLPPGMRLEVIEHFSETCRACGQRGAATRGPDGRSWEVARVVPPSQGGRYVWGNVVLLCSECNRCRGDRGANMTSLEGEARGVTEDGLGVSNGASRGVTAMTHESPGEPPGKPNTPSPTAREPVTVSEIPVTEAEHDLCDAILAAFNEAAGGTDFRGPEHRRAIIGRTRERPEMDAAAHREMIARNFAAPWWRDSPSPGVLYGSSRAFEQAVNRRPSQQFSHQRGGEDDDLYDRGRTD